ncbi:N-acetylglucosamine kinase [Thaumasiovibrio subtropicus]|uniref:N-acetylglucosamine kinase n=1 Tax=Thaumasiovibrio subtropicus TaxID=1891207 RepID=UPI000B36122A|nr:N-acetylglucosamine kinase [Thaumasiovibrio subtropicus]
MYYGFDVGGTKIEFGAFDNDLNRVATKRVPTPTTDYQELIDTLATLVREADEEFGVEGKIGIGLPGMEEAETGAVLTVNIGAAKGKTLRKDLEAELGGRHVALENDANCFALSEAWDEDLQHYPSVAGLIMGTGFGGGLIYNGKVFSGKNNVAGELGHMRLPLDAWLHLGENAPMFDCGCENKGCIDNYLSGRGFEMLYAHQYGESLKAIQVIENFYAGEEKAVEFVDMYLELVAICFGNMMTALDSHVIVLGGGLSNFDEIYRQVPERMQKHLLSVAKPPAILKAKHGDSGGVRGAAFLNIE